LVATNPYDQPTPQQTPNPPQPLVDRDLDQFQM
jgi:hypothetical protein